MGLAKEKDYKAVHNKVWALKIGERAWQPKTPVPSSLTLKGRLASVAVSIDEHVYLFGGYTVDRQHNEISSPDVYRYNVLADSYEKLAAMPVPVDDSVALVYQQRYIYLVSGWHDAGNINLVQVYDIQTDTWSQASPFLGVPVFGHSGGIAGNRMVICDGVAVVPQLLNRRKYNKVAQCLIGRIDQTNHLKIDWQLLSHPTNEARYRMAATNFDDKIIMLAGSTNPYNYNGIGYDGIPAPATSKAWVFDVHKHYWRVRLGDGLDSMDHRGLLIYQNHLITIGGMGIEQRVLDEVIARPFTNK
ncbi:galactose oxidase [Thalassomonas sp. M1454]|nr:galactose oxidase [Thalassomonas sp. M1454]